MRFILLCLCVLLFGNGTAWAQRDKLPKTKIKTAKAKKSKGTPGIDPPTRMQGSYTKKTDWANYEGEAPMRSSYNKRTDWANFEGTPRMISTFQRVSLFKNFTSVGLGVGQSNYYGDFSSYRALGATVIKTTRYNIGAHYQRNITEKLATRIGFSFISLMGDDQNFYQVDQVKYSRGLHFRNNIKEVSLQGVYAFQRGTLEKTPDARTSRLVPFVFGGVALFTNNPKAKEPISEGSKWITLRDLYTEGQATFGTKPYKSLGLAIPFGLGFKKRLNDNFDLSLEGSFRYTLGNTGKYIDDVAKTYATGSTASPLTKLMTERSGESTFVRNGKDKDLGYLTPVNTAQPRGNNRQDIYFTSVIKLNYYLYKSRKNLCPTEEIED
jgi:hypothetical protein